MPETQTAMCCQLVSTQNDKQKSVSKFNKQFLWRRSSSQQECIQSWVDYMETCNLNLYLSAIQNTNSGHGNMTTETMESNRSAVSAVQCFVASWLVHVYSNLNV